MTHPSIPNLFTHARSELAQDAVIAYLIQWADPHYKAHNPYMNALGEYFLRQLLCCSSQATGVEGLADGETITAVTVKTQIRGIDILTIVNGRIALIIEDKINTHEHDEQIVRYRQVVSQILAIPASELRIHAVYLKTGNESPHLRPNLNLCGVIYRNRLLEIFHQHPNSTDLIIQQFQQHLKLIEADTQSYQTQPPNSWSRRAIEGFYESICLWLEDLYRNGELIHPPHPKWSYQANPQGGELVCAWWWIHLEASQLQAWLQLVDANLLQVRVANLHHSDVKAKVTPQQMYELLHRATQRTTCPSWQERLFVKKAGRFGGGDSAAVVTLSFDPAHGTWLPTNPQGLLDWPETCRRLRIAMDFLQALGD